MESCHRYEKRKGVTLGEEYQHGSPLPDGNTLILLPNTIAGFCHGWWVFSPEDNPNLVIQRIKEYNTARERLREVLPDADKVFGELNGSLRASASSQEE